MGEKKEPIKMSLGTLFLILIIFILLTIILVMYLENKNIISINLKGNENESIIENKVENVEDVNDKEDKFKKIILEGNYVMKNSDLAYIFSKDGTVKRTSSMTEVRGTYYTISENEIEIKFTEEMVTEDDDLENTIVKDVNIIVKCILKENDFLHMEYEEDGKKYEHDVIKDDFEQEKNVYERLEEKYSNVIYRRETEGSSGYYIQNGLVYTDPGYLTQGVVGKAKYVIPVNKQIGEAMVLTEYGKVFLTVEGIGVQVVKFEELKLDYKIIEVINIPEEEGHLLVADDGTILNIDGTIFGKV